MTLADPPNSPGPQRGNGRVLAAAQRLQPVDDTGEGLSIVVQGSLSAGNLAETANSCAHWRTLFPQAEIILAISTSDLVAESQGAVQDLHDLQLLPRHKDDGGLQTAARRLRQACDRIVLSEGALPLPPIKFDQKVNNVNLQIVAAKAGLAKAKHAYVLRIRSDMVFLDRSFLRFYNANATLPRHATAVFGQRVMISPFFTLNPFTMERLPFHYSDWFHFGLREDVQRIWDVGEMPLATATHFEAHQHPPRANRLERKFRVRVAVEQYLAFSCFSRLDGELRLDHLIDRRSVDRSVRILLNDFLVYDPKQVPTAFDKYASAFRDPMMDLLCITYPQWRALLDLPEDADFESYYSRAAKRAGREISIREEPLLRPVKFVRGAWRLLRRRRDEAKDILAQLAER